MSDSNTEDYGGVEQDLEGSMVTRKVQDGGRLNFPDEYLQSIGVEDYDRVFIIVRNGCLEVIKADAENLAISGVVEGIRAFLSTIGGDD